MSFLKKFGADVDKIFHWLASPSGRKVVVSGETIAEIAATAAGVGAPVQAGINLLNNWAGEALKTEALAAAAGVQNGSGPQKAAAVINAMTPELVTYMQAQGIVKADVAANAQAINNALVALLNALPVKENTPPPPQIQTEPVQTTTAPAPISTAANVPA